MAPNLHLKSLGGVSVKYKLIFSLFLISSPGFGQSSQDQCKTKAEDFINKIFNKPNSAQHYISPDQNSPAEITAALNKATNAAKKMYKIADQRLVFTKLLKTKMTDEIRVMDHLIEVQSQELSSRTYFCDSSTADGKRVCKAFYSTEKKRLAETFGIREGTLRFQTRLAFKQNLARREAFVEKLPEIEAKVAIEEEKKKQIAERIISTINQHRICDQVYFKSINFKFVSVEPEKKVESISLVELVRKQSQTDPADLSAN
jgi:hypothetical protein